jgi:hypothetical protein
LVKATIPCNAWFAAVEAQAVGRGGKLMLFKGRRSPEYFKAMDGI